MSNIDTLSKNLAKKFNKVSRKVHMASELENKPVISSGSVSLDFATKCGGYPLGSVVEIFGRPGCGKSTLGLTAIAEAQRAGHNCVYVNIEGPFMPEWAQTQGVDTDKLLYVAPDPGSECVEVLHEVVRDGSARLVVFDSIGMMMNDKEMEADSKARVGGASGVVTQMVKRIGIEAWRNDVVLVLINQARERMDSPVPDFESPGGNALKHVAGIRVKLRRSKRAEDLIKHRIDSVEKPVAHRVYADIIKNKFSSDNTKASWMFVTDDVPELGLSRGIDKVHDLAGIAMSIGVIEQSGAYYKNIAFPDGQIHSKAAVFDYLRGNPEAWETIRKEVMEYTRARNPMMHTAEEIAELE